MINRLLLRIKNTIWVIPTLFSISAFLLAVFMVYIDHRYFDKHQTLFPDVFLVDVDLSKTILGIIAGALLTMTSITFSTIMVVLTTYSSQFSPRTLQNFIRDSKTMRVLGVFIGGFVYAIFALLFMQEKAEDNHVLTALIGVLIAFICVAFFVYFIHHIAASVQVNKLIEDLARDVLTTIKEQEEKIRKNRHLSLLKEKPTIPVNLSEKKHIYSKDFGYLQLINEEELYKKACEFGYCIEVHKKMGEFVSENKLILTIFKNKNTEVSIGDEIAIGNERTILQDVDFGLEKLAEVALRAISPGINDPNTAIECIHHLGMCLRAVSKLDGSYLVYYDDNNRMILSIPQRTYKEMLRSCFYQICHYGKDDISILITIYEALYEIAVDNSKTIIEQTLKFSEYLEEKINQNTFPTFDRELLLQKHKALHELKN